jgi:LPXTG-site transpeptidase (sortase) family protein
VGLVQVAGTDALAPTSDGAATGLQPDRSAADILDRRQRRVLASGALVVVALLLIAPLPTLIGIMAVITVVYFSVVCQRIEITRRSLREADLVRVSDEEARALPDHVLPVYTVLVPAYREANVVGALIAHLEALEYPRRRLDLKLLLEADDTETIEAARAAGSDFEIVLVPPGEPRTKPKALNWGLATAQGEIVTIYDAEDIPDPLQLRRVVAAFRRLPPDVACLQAQLTFHDWDRNVITRWFTIEYLMWFSLFLPGLSSTDAPVPLGGTSNHVRRDVLEAIGAWDAFNVTEDADLGVRLHCQGWRTAVLDSVTYEEPNRDFVNWMKQRSRWYKGYLQTWLVNLRHPLALARALGPGGFAQFNLFVGGTPGLALINPIFWLLTLAWFAGKAHVIQQMFPAPLYHLALFCWIVGNVAVLYLTVLAARRSDRPSLVWAACLVPAYWVMMSMAAVKAFWQVLAAPSFWEKTTHGLTEHPVWEGSRPTPIALPAGTARLTLGPSPILWTAPGLAAPAAAVAVGPAGPVLGDGLPSPRPAGLPRRVGAGPDPWPGSWVRVARGIRIAGIVAVLFVGYLILGTGWRADASQAALRAELAATAPGRAPRIGAALARLRASAAGLDAVVVEGTRSRDLIRGPGHVPGSANPGALGEVVIVGHRVMAGGPFAHLGSLQAGDAVELTAPWGKARYEVVGAGRRTDAVGVSTGAPARLTLVTAGTGLSLSPQVVVHARLVTALLPRAPRPARQHPHLPGTDLHVAPLLVAAILAGLLAWHARRWFVPLWGRTRAVFVMAPLVAVAGYEAFTVAVRLLPPTF